MKDNKKSLSVYTAWYSVGNFIIRSISFLLLPLYSNLLSTTEFGDYALLVSMYSIIAVLYQSGMQNALTKYYLENENQVQRKKIFSSIFNSIVISGILLTCLSIIFSKGISQLILGTQHDSKLISIIFIALFFETLSFFPLHLLKTKEKARKVVTYSSVSAVINLLLNVVFVYKMRMDIEGIFIAQMLSSLALTIIVFPSVLPEIQMYIDKVLLKKMFLFSLPFVVSGLFSSAVDVSDRFILNIFTSKDEVGIYTLSYKIAMIMNVFVISFRTAWIPRALNVYNSQNYSVIFGNTLKKLTSVSLTILLCITLFSPYLFHIRLFGVTILNKNFEPGLVILPYILLGYFFSGLAIFYSLFPFISSKSYYFLYSDLIAFVVNILLNFILIPLVGMVGAAIATTLAYFASALFLFFISRRKINITYPIKNLSTIIISCLVLLIIGMNLKNLLVDVVIIIIYLTLIVRLSKISLAGLFSIT